MNRALADVLATLNAAAGLIIVAGGGLLGFERYHPYGTASTAIGVVFGLLCGLAVAAAVCGTLATLMLIETICATSGP